MRNNPLDCRLIVMSRLSIMHLIKELNSSFRWKLNLKWRKCLILAFCFKSLVFSCSLGTVLFSILLSCFVAFFFDLGILCEFLYTIGFCRAHEAVYQSFQLLIRLGIDCFEL